MQATEEATQQKNILVVLGMARSGTSAIARGLKALGICLGDKLTDGNEKWNPKGFWEDNDIVYNINGGVFSRLNFPSYGIQLINSDELTGEKLSDLKQRAIELLTQRFKSTSWWGFKDPSTVKLLPFWQSVFDASNISDHYVIALRNPLSVAQSYKNLTGAELEIGLLLWIMHTLPAIEGTHHKKRIIVSYDLLLHHPRAQLDRIQNQLKLSLTSEPTELDKYVNEFLDKKLHHYEYSRDDLMTHPAARAIPLCLRVYDVLMKLAKDEVKFESDEFAISWQGLKNELEKEYPTFCYIDSLLKRNKQLEKKLKTINKSVLWKMIYPFRLIDDAFRARRRKLREKRRLLKAY